MQAHRKNLRLHLQHGPPLSPGVAVARPVSPAGLAGSSLPAAEQAAAKRQRLAHGAPDTGVPLQPAGTGSQGRAWTNGSGGDAAGAGTPNGAGHGAQARQQGRQAGGPEQLPADVRALVAQVFGPVRPAAVPEALRYLWEEGVRQFRWALQRPAQRPLRTPSRPLRAGMHVRQRGAAVAAVLQTCPPCLLLPALARKPAPPARSCLPWPAATCNTWTTPTSGARCPAPSALVPLGLLSVAWLSSCLL